jgi:ornithine carbamoyltransferase
MDRNFLSMDDLSPDELGAQLDLSDRVKASPDDYRTRLAGRAVAMIFEKPSTRTRISFEVGIASLGAHPLALSSAELQLGRGETIEDTGRVLSRYVDAVVLRTFGHDRLVSLANASTIPIVNALSDHEHPCQCLADLLTIREHKGKLEGLTLTYVGDGNNVAHSLLLGGAKAGMSVRVAAPNGYDPDPVVVRRAEQLTQEAGAGGEVVVTDDVAAACRNADVLYTDVWASMGQEAEANERTRVFERYRLDAAAVEVAAPDCIVMHCLPAHRGQEIIDEVIDGPHSVVWDQAENRLHTQKALLLTLLGAA